MAFQRGETIVCKIEVRNAETGNLTDPVTSTKITIVDPAGDPAMNSGTVAVTGVVMDNDGVGLFHYNFTPNDTYDVGPPIKEVAELGKYLVRYTLDDDSILTIEDDDFVLEE